MAVAYDIDLAGLADFANVDTASPDIGASGLVTIGGGLNAMLVYDERGIGQFANNGVRTSETFLFAGRKVTLDFMHVADASSVLWGCPRFVDGAHFVGLEIGNDGMKLRQADGTFSDLSGTHSFSFADGVVYSVDIYINANALVVVFQGAVVLTGTTTITSSNEVAILVIGAQSTGTGNQFTRLRVNDDPTLPVARRNQVIAAFGRVIERLRQPFASVIMGSTVIEESEEETGDGTAASVSPTRRSLFRGRTRRGGTGQT